MFISKLINISSSITNELINTTLDSSLPKDILGLLSIASGLIAFESALIVRPISNHHNILDVQKWNEFSTWKKFYNNPILENYVFFAEDIFGNQFGICDNKIYYFNLETGDITFFANSLEKWAEEIMNDYQFHTGYNFAHQWQVKNGKILANYRLCPKIPFVLGGEYSLDNFICSPLIQNISYLASIAIQIQNIPDGTKIKICIENSAIVQEI